MRMNWNDEPQSIALLRKTLRYPLILKMQRFFASLRMTLPARFSAAC